MLAPSPTKLYEATYHLVGEHEHRFERELALAVVEQVFQGGTEQVDHHHVVVTLHAKPMHVWNANYRDRNRSKLVKILNLAIDRTPLEPVRFL